MQNQTDISNSSGTIILKASEDTLDMFVSRSMTKGEVMQILMEALHAIDDVDVGLDDIVPEGAFGANTLQ